jgi:cytochrome bd-type quinol oxidase subunit 2
MLLPTDAENKRAFTRATTELLFVLLPFIVIGITLGHRGELRTFFYIPEWSIVSAVIVGQAISKAAYSAMGHTNIRKENVNLVIAACIVCLLVPILIVLAIVLISPNVSTTLAITQAIFFLLSGIVFG